MSFADAIPTLRDALAELYGDELAAIATACVLGLTQMRQASTWQVTH